MSAEGEVGLVDNLVGKVIDNAGLGRFLEAEFSFLCYSVINLPFSFT